VWVFFFFPFFGTFESNKQQSKEGNQMGGGENCWMYSFAIKEKQPNQTKFVNKVVKFCQQSVKK
jgi:hypothetical protein